ncbi:MAG TPA: tRNA epoxyqueuosine(34) reductase QueG [Candidatus Saccharimonadales bacterium]|nr:tRNA epoxyqueuosine(34) reductase QueG [Candidatus Saccharimonadales bacterium]
MKTASDTTWIVEQAKAEGFALCGVARAEKFPELAHDDWLANGYAGQMKYLADSRRSDPQSVMPDIRSVIVCVLNYNSDQPLSTEAMNRSDSQDPHGWLSRYAWGDDYHEVLWTKLEALSRRLREHFTESFQARVYADTGPIQERVFAKHAGLGWIGKNTLLLNQEIGSLFFLGVILTTLDLQPSLTEATSVTPDRCGTCQRCIEACPTDALFEPYVMDARKCISYLTIELRGSIPEELRRPMGTHVYGCDICQDVCPWNSKAPISGLEEFRPRTFSGSEREENSLFSPRLLWLLNMSEDEFRKVFRGSPVKRAKRQGLLRNACIAAGNSAVSLDDEALRRLTATLQKLASLDDSVIKESALWALSSIQELGRQGHTL